jgi:hypothetical protein
MPEMSITRKHHYQPMFIRRCNNFLIAHAATGLDHCFCARFGQYVYTVSEREEGV